MHIYKNKRVLITGHTGFKGVWLTSILNLLGAEVMGISKDLGHSKPLLRANIAEDQSFEIDIRDSDRLHQKLQDLKPDLIFHLAAQSLVLESYINPISTFETNFTGTLNLLRASSKLAGLKGVVLATTDKVYRNNNSIHRFTEDDPLGGHDPYSASKSCASILISSWKDIPENQNKKFIDVRAGNVIGGGDRAKNRLMPDLITAALSQETLTLRNPESVRPWQHVLDPLFGYLQVGERILNESEIDGPYNFGPPEVDSLRVKEVAQVFRNNFPSVQIEESFSHSKLKESNHLQLNSSRAINELGWESRIPAHEAVKLTIDWEISVDKLELTAEEATQKQILDYLALNM